MRNTMKLNRVTLLLGLGCVVLPLGAYAAPPSTGVILQQPTTVNPMQNERQIIRPDQQGNMGKPSDGRSYQEGQLTIRQIQFQHDLRNVRDAELQQFIQPYLNKTYFLSEFREITTALQQWLQQRHGLIKAQVWIPLQEVESGTVQIKISQGSLVGYQVSDNISPQQAKKISMMAEQILAKGSPLRQQQLEEVAYRAIDYVGRPVQIVLVPTAEVGKYQVLLDVAKQSKVTGSISLDNTGNRYTSEFRDYSNISFNDLTGHQDSLSVAAQVMNQYQHAGQIRYEIPSINGWRFGLNGQYSDYQLCCEFKALDVQGEVTELSADAFYTLQRQRALSLWLGARAKHWNSESEQLGMQTTDREINSLSLLSNISWSNFADHYLQLEVTGGQVKLGNAADQAMDKVSADIAGNFAKFKANYFLNAPLAAHSTAAMQATAQFANKNLESSEKLSMGGLSAIRAYPYGEAMGDSAAVAQLEYRYRILPTLQTAAFYDMGYVQRNMDEWDSTTKNQYHLHGAGASLTWQPIQSMRLQLIGAAKLGENAGQDSNGYDSDGKDSRVRGWIVGSWSF